jgi:hypothetical protein
MTRKATDVVTTIGIDIGKNRLHLIGLEGCFGSKAAVGATSVARRLSGVKQTKSAGKRTSIMPASSVLNRIEPSKLTRKRASSQSHRSNQLPIQIVNRAQNRYCASLPSGSVEPHISRSPSSRRPQRRQARQSTTKSTKLTASDVARRPMSSIKKQMAIDSWIC